MTAQIIPISSPSSRGEASNHSDNLAMLGHLIVVEQQLLARLLELDYHCSINVALEHKCETIDEAIQSTRQTLDKLHRVHHAVSGMDKAEQPYAG